MAQGSFELEVHGINFSPKDPAAENVFEPGVKCTILNAEGKPVEFWADEAAAATPLAEGAVKLGSKPFELSYDSIEAVANTFMKVPRCAVYPCVCPPHSRCLQCCALTPPHPHPTHGGGRWRR